MSGPLSQCGNLDTDPGEAHVKPEAEMGVRHLPTRKAKDCQKTPETRRDKESSSLRLCGGVCHCQHLAFRLLDSRTVKEYVSVVLSHPAGGNELR